MADDNTIIEGNVKFREGKKWKSRWCVMRRLSPVADSVQLEVWAEAGARGGACKAALALEQALGIEAGFTLDRHSHTLALVCARLVVVLAFESRERLMQWQVKARAALGAGRAHTVLVPARSGRLPAGPATLLLRDARFALTAGVPPRLLGVWELRHLRRYGVVDGRFCFEGGSLCGRGEGLHVLVSDRAGDLARDFELAALGRLEPARRATLSSETCERADDGEADSRPADGAGAEAGRAALALDLADTASLCGARGGGAGLARCVSCMSKLGALSRSSTAALTPGARHFSPAWTMDAAPPRPPKPPALSPATPRHPCDTRSGDDRSLPSVGPYENYDVPRTPFTEIGEENYDTPKRLKECIESDLFRITENCSADAMILKKQCGCLLQFGRRRREPMVIDVDENFQPPGCPCRRVTNWANDWIKFPYCKRKTPGERTETPTGDPSALYATVDVSQKSRKRTPLDQLDSLDEHRVKIDDGPLGNYENLKFALSLEHYENARDMLRRAGVTQAELNALGATLRRGARAGDRVGDYLLMRPERGAPGPAPPAGYTPMSPVGSFAFHTLRRHPAPALSHQKSASNPALGDALSPDGARPASGEGPRRRRSNSADSSRFLEDVVEFEDGGSSSSLETLRAGGDAGLTPAAAPANRDSSSSADSGVSSCSARGAAGPGGDYELPATTSAARRQWAGARRAAGAGAAGARRSRSAGAVGMSAPPPPRPAPAKSSSAEAEVPLLRLLRGASGPGDARSWSSGASDMSDYIETMSLCSSHSSTDTPITLRWVPASSRVRPRSAAEYRPVTAPSHFTLPSRH